ncbi:Ubiquitin-conjugating enzyme/RWD-like protein [Cryptosporidium meleagridis]
MDDLNLELEALQAIYSDKELTIETKENCQIINIQLIKEANCEINSTCENNQSIKFIKIKVAFLINQGYPEKSPPEINNINICILDGKYSNNECAIDNCHDEGDDNRILFDDSTCIYINTDEVINYYDSFKESYIGRVCLFDIIENLQVFIDDITSKLISDQEFQADDTKFGLDSVGRDEEEEDDDDEVIYSGLTERILCPIEERVSEEQFNLWKIAFKSEMIEKKIWRNENQDSSQLTGKKLFEKDESLIRSDENSSAIIESTYLL